MLKFCKVTILALACSNLWSWQMHDHGVPEKLGQVSFFVSCGPQTQAEFNRGVALLHSFAYSAANASFRKIVAQDSGCAMAHWGVAMTYFYQLWDPQLEPDTLPLAAQEIDTARRLGAPSAREQAFIQALSLVVKDADRVPFPTRDLLYEHAMAGLARDNRQDVEAQVFYALALLSNAPPTDKTHARQKLALAILEPLGRAHPDHPGITHYIIHACDSSELAPRGLAAARKYAQVAPSAPHALHMPSHIFTRLGLWQDSIASNLASSKAAREQGDIGEELHAEDYLVYAYLQLGRNDEARGVIDRFQAMNNLGTGDFKGDYAATAMPVRYAVERRQWENAAKIAPKTGSPPQVAAIAVWARGLGRTRSEHPSAVTAEIASLQQLEEQLHHASDEYWAAQVRILRKEVAAWAARANGDSRQAQALLLAAADEEDAIEKLPVTPGPIVPAREQLGELLLELHQPAEAAVAFRTSLVNAPNRRGAMTGLSKASQMVSEK